MNKYNYQESLDKKEVNNKYEIPEWVEITLFIGFVLTAIIVIIWLTFTLLSWLIPYEGELSLIEVIKGQWEFVKRLRIL
jgi:hypothetical protein